MHRPRGERGKSPSSRPRSRAAILLVLTAFVAVATAYSFLFALGEGNDEVSHFRYIRYVAERGKIPLTAEERREAGPEGGQPPLYYVMAAAATGWVDIGGVPTLKVMDPEEHPRHLLASDVWERQAILHTEDELFPYNDIALAWHVARLLSVALGASSYGAESTSKKVYWIPINDGPEALGGMVDTWQRYFVKENIAKARSLGADLIVFDITTYGGQVLSADKILNEIIRAEPIETVAEWYTPSSPYTAMSDSVTDTVDELLAGTSLELTKGDAIIAYALALEEIQPLMWSSSNYDEIQGIIDAVRVEVQAAATALGSDPELLEIDALLELYRTKFD